MMRSPAIPQGGGGASGSAAERFMNLPSPEVYAWYWSDEESDDGMDELEL